MCIIWLKYFRNYWAAVQEMNHLKYALKTMPNGKMSLGPAEVQSYSEHPGKSYSSPSY